MVGAALAQLDRSLKQALPLILTALIALLSVVPLPIPEYAVLAPNLVLICAFYWIVHRPDLFPEWGAFAIGLFDDALSGAPLGLNAFVLLVVHATITGQHKFFRGKAFWLIWASFAVLSAAVAVATLLLVFIVMKVVAAPGLFLAQLGLTIAIYPAAAALLGRIQRLFLPGG